MVSPRVTVLLQAERGDNGEAGQLRACFRQSALGPVPASRTGTAQLRVVTQASGSDLNSTCGWLTWGA